MPKMKYAIEKGGSKRLEISWKGNWKGFTVRLDGNEIGTIADSEQLKTGQTFSLEDGSLLTVQLVGRSIFPYLRLLRDGQPLPSPGPEPAKRLSIAYKLTFLIGGMNIIAGLIGTFFRADLLPFPNMGLLSIVVGCFLFLLAFFIMRMSRIALAIVVGLFALDTVFFAMFFRQNLPRVGFILVVVFRIFVLFAIAQGFGAIRALKQSQPEVGTKSTV